MSYICCIKSRIGPSRRRIWKTCHEAEDQTSDGLLVKYLAVCFSPESGIHEDILSSYPGQLANLHGLKQKLWFAQSIAEMRSPKFTIYDRDSCTDFHKFLVATLIGHAKSLHTLYTKGKKNDPSVANSLTDFHGYVSLLHIITKSHAFRLHIGVLAHSKHLSLPNYYNINEYQSFGAAQGLDWIIANRSRTKGKTAKADGKGTVTGRGKGNGNGNGNRGGRREREGERGGKRLGEGMARAAGKRKKGE